MHGRGGVLVLGALALLMAPLYAAQTSAETEAVTVQSYLKTASGFEAVLQFAEPEFTSAGTSTSGSDDNAVRADLPGAVHLSQAGCPSVPVVGRLFRLPPNARAVVEVVDAEYETLTDLAYEPGDAGQTGVDAWLPGPLAELHAPAILHDFRVANLHTCPVQVNPARREVRVYRTLSIVVRFEGDGHIENPLPQSPTTISETFLPYYRRFMDWDESELDEFEVVRGAVQVVARQSALNQMEDWIAWKRQRGWELEFLTPAHVFSWTAGAIKDELQARWDAAEQPFDYIVIVGDATGGYSVPPGEGYGDHEYGLLAGDDPLVDCAISRISVATVTQIAAYVNKVLAYEKEPYQEDDSWFTRGSVSASSENSGISIIYAGRYVRDLMLDADYAAVDTAWWTQGNSGWVNQQDIAHLSSGVSLYHHRGYLGTGLNPNQINALQNDHMTPMVIDLTCSTGDWTLDGINEAWMRAGAIHSPRGAIAAMGMHTSGTHTRFNNALAGGAWQSILQDRTPTVGQAGVAAKLNLYVSFSGHQDGAVEDFSEWCNIMGDPTVFLWTGSPKPLWITSDSVVANGVNVYPVSVRDSLTGASVENAWVTLVDSANPGEVISRGQSGADGMAWLDLDNAATGILTLTISAQHYRPVQRNVHVQSEGDRIIYTDVAVIDDGSEGTSGNGNSIAEAGERVGLRFTLRNIGDITHSLVEVTLDGDDPWVNELSGMGILSSLPPDSIQTTDGLVLVELDQDTPNSWIARFAVSIASEQGCFTDHYALNVSAMQLVWTTCEMWTEEDSVIGPGESGFIRCSVANMGARTIPGPISANLISDDLFVAVEQGSGSVQTLGPGQMGETNEFRIQVHSSTFNGRRARMGLVVVSGESMRDTLWTTLTLGEVSQNDPVGPDAYGYYAFDHTDTSDYADYAPQFDWIEINPVLDDIDFNGTMLPLQDSTDNQDDAIVVDLPFPVRYYGEQFFQITVTVNGFVALGAQPDLPLQRNWTIPSPLGPDAMIAPYWDERMTGDDSAILWHHDENNNRLIIEWYRVYDAGGFNPCTFELIIYDLPDPDTTWTGDHDIVFQYAGMNHSPGLGSDVPYYTTGIEDPAQEQGLQVAYWNSITPGMAPVDSGMAIRFTTNVIRLMGCVDGYITHANDEAPIEGVYVATQDGQAEAMTDSSGYFLLERIVAGRINLVAVQNCYNPVQQMDITVAQDETTRVDLSMTAPIIAVSPAEAVDTVHAHETSSIPFTIHNSGDGELEYEVGIRFQDDEAGMQFRERVEPLFDQDDLDDLVEPWDWAYSFPVSEYDSRNRGVVFDGHHFWVSGSNGVDPNNINQLYQYDRYGSFINRFPQPVGEGIRTAQGFYGMTTDGEYLYGADGGWLYQMERQWDLVEGDWRVTGIRAVDSIPTPVNPARYLTYDPERDLFWMGDYGIQVHGVNRAGEIVYQYPQEFFPRGAGYYADDPDGYALYFIGQPNGSDITRFYKMDPETGDAVQVYNFMAREGPIHPCGADITGLWNPLVWVMASIIDASPEDGLQMWVIGENQDYFTVEPPEGVLEPIGETTVTIELDGALMNQGTYQFYAQLHHNSCTDQNDRVHLTIVAPDTTTMATHENAQPLQWAITGVYPNPFNPVATVAFSLKEAVTVRARLYDVLGREVAVLAEERRAAGHHQLTIHGETLASGMYFLRLQAGPINETRKLLLLK